MGTHYRYIQKDIYGSFIKHSGMVFRPCLSTESPSKMDRSRLDNKTLLPLGEILIVFHLPGARVMHISTKGFKESEAWHSHGTYIKGNHTHKPTSFIWNPTSKKLIKENHGSDYSQMVGGHTQ